MSRWERELRELFASIREPLGCILNASGCREGWLQGEAFRFLRGRNQAIYTNYLTLPSVSGLKNCKADLACYETDSDNAKLLFVAEIKVYGERGYYPKNLTGGGLAQLRRRLATSETNHIFRNCPDDRQLLSGPGLLADYFRLVDFVSVDEPERMLLLCVQRHKTPDDLGILLRQVEFEQSGTILSDCETHWVKSWTVGSSLRG